MTSLGAECYAGTITADTINYKTLNPALTGFVHNPLNSDLQGNNFDVGTAGSKVDTIYCNTLDYTALNPPINAGITNPLAADIQGNNKNIGIAGSEVNEFKGTSGSFTTTTTTTLITDDLTANSSASLPNGTTAGSLSVPTGNINIALGELNVSAGDTSLQKLDVGNLITSTFTGAEALVTNSKIKIGQNGSGESAEFSGTTLFDDNMTINSSKEITVDKIRGHGSNTITVAGSGGLTVASSSGLVVGGSSGTTTTTLKVNKQTEVADFKMTHLTYGTVGGPIIISVPPTGQLLFDMGILPNRAMIIYGGQSGSAVNVMFDVETHTPQVLEKYTPFIHICQITKGSGNIYSTVEKSFSYTLTSGTPNPNQSIFNVDIKGNYQLVAGDCLKYMVGLYKD